MFKKLALLFVTLLTATSAQAESSCQATQLSLNQKSKSMLEKEVFRRVRYVWKGAFLLSRIKILGFFNYQQWHLAVIDIWTSNNRAIEQQEEPLRVFYSEKSEMRATFLAPVTIADADLTEFQRASRGIPEGLIFCTIPPYTDVNIKN